jgi:hypothetical protein
MVFSAAGDLTVSPLGDREFCVVRTLIRAATT